MGARAPTPITVQVGVCLTGATAAADRTISFRQVVPQPQLDCRSGQSCRTKNRRRSCRTRGEQAATQRVHRVERLERRDGMDGRHVGDFGRLLVDGPSTGSLLWAVYHRLPSTVYHRLPGRR